MRASSVGGRPTLIVMDARSGYGRADPGVDTRGVLYPARLPTLARYPAPDRVSPWVRWFWIPEWDIAPGRVSRQHLLPYPACNLVVGPEGTELSGPSTRASHRDLTGTGWAVGALLRPAAAGVLCPDGPAELRDTSIPIDMEDLERGVQAAMSSGDPAPARHAGAVAAFADWLASTLPAPTPEALLANEMASLADASPDWTVTQLAEALHVSRRTLQRLAHEWVGLPPSAMLRRRRLQEAMKRIRTEPQTRIAEVAADLGFVDHAHLTHQVRDDVGITPARYRDEVTEGR